MILRRFDGASVAVVLHNGNVLAVVVHFALLGDHRKLGSAKKGSKLRGWGQKTPKLETRKFENEWHAFNPYCI